MPSIGKPILKIIKERYVLLLIFHLHQASQEYASVTDTTACQKHIVSQTASVDILSNCFGSTTVRTVPKAIQL